jgi:hypothetical protein
MSPRRPSAHAAASLLDSDDEGAFCACHLALVLCDSDNEVLILHPMHSCVPATFRPFVRF